GGGQPALLVYPPGLEFISAFFGCLYGGAIAVPVYPPDPMRLERSLPRLRAIIDDARPVVALTTSQFLPMIEGMFAQAPDLRSLCWLTTDDVADDMGNRWQDPHVNGDTVAVLQYTSGSTAIPKGVMVSHQNLLYASAYLDALPKFTPDSVALTWAPTFHDMGLVMGVTHPMHTGFRAILMSPLAFLQRPGRWLEGISRYKATHSGGPNFAYDLCVRKSTPEQRAKLDLSSWRVAYIGTEPVRKATLEGFVAA